MNKIQLKPFLQTFKLWPVPKQWQTELHNYIIQGWMPGSFHTALFANDLLGAALHTHPMNDWDSIVHFMKWVKNNAPREAWGSYEDVQYWYNLTPKIRNMILLRNNLILTDEETMWESLKE